MSAVEPEQNGGIENDQSVDAINRHLLDSLNAMRADIPKEKFDELIIALGRWKFEHTPQQPYSIKAESPLPRQDFSKLLRPLAEYFLTLIDNQRVNPLVYGILGTLAAIGDIFENDEWDKMNRRLDEMGGSEGTDSAKKILVEPVRKAIAVAVPDILEVAETVTEGTLTGIKVFVIDDEEMMRALNSRIVKNKGAELLGSYELAQTFFEKVQSGEIDISGATIITDHKMSGMNGDVLAKELHERFPEKKFKILMVSGGGTISPEAVSALIAAGHIDAFLQKPYEQAEFLAAIARINGREIPAKQ